MSDSETRRSDREATHVCQSRLGPRPEKADLMVQNEERLDESDLGGPSQKLWPIRVDSECVGAER